MKIMKEPSFFMATLYWNVESTRGVSLTTSMENNKYFSIIKYLIFKCNKNNKIINFQHGLKQILGETKRAVGKIKRF